MLDRKFFRYLLIFLGLLLVAALAFVHLWESGADGASQNVDQLAWPGFAFIVFAVAFFLNVAYVTTKSICVILLLLQIVCALLSAFELLFLVAAYTPFIFSSRVAIAWILFQITLVAPVDYVMFYNERQAESLSTGFLELSGFVLLDTIWQLFAFMLGWLSVNTLRKSQRVESLNTQLLQAQAELAEKSRLDERLAISREIHDNMGHHLVALKVNLDLASLHSTSDSREPIDAARDLTKTLLREVRSVVSSLSSMSHDLHSLLKQLVAKGPPKVVVIYKVDVALDTKVMTTLYRCAQEAITNSRKHADASLIEVEVYRDQHDVVLRVSDNGKGAEVIADGCGIANMRERVAMINGDLDMRSGTEKGFRLFIRAPLSTATHINRDSPIRGEQ